MKKFYIALLAILISVVAKAQRDFGIATSNWCGTNSLYLNPASIADSRDRFSIDILSVNIGADNSLGTLNFQNGVNHLLNNNNNTGFNIDNVFNYSSKQQFNMFAPYAEIHGPGFMYRINHKHSIALTTRLRGFNQLNNFDQSLYRTINNGGTGDYNLTSKNFNWTAQLWSEIGLSYGVVLYEKKKHLLKAGVTLRYLGGVGFLGVVGNNLNAHYYSASDSLKAYETNVKFASNLVSSNTTLQNNLTTSDLLNRFLGSKGGSGVGADIGVIYEYRPDIDKYKYDMDGKTGLTDPSKNTYLLRLSASVTDIGFIKYTSANVSAANLNANGYISGNDVRQNVRTFEDFRNYAINHGFTVDTNVANTTTVHIPTALLLGADYHIWKGFYVNATYINNLVNRQAYGNSYYNQVTITPRFDIRLFSIGLPVTYSALANDIKMGIGVRIAGFFFGSDDMLALFSNNQYGFNFYVGGRVPFYKFKPRDRDHDNVSDRKDLCPDVPGTWEFHGCPDPDRDHDGIPDSLDKCPDVPGSPTAMGCPDRDRDSVADDEDRCPDQPGPRSLKGCPDRDHDGIPDIDDACPDVPGLAQFNGCPDPDKDHDGVPDSIDKCPDVPGSPTAFGCPDRDKDSVADAEDRCPDQPGPRTLRGCPDRDHDGVPDIDDSCKDVPGPASNHGCPVPVSEVKQEVKKRLAYAATAIEFQTGKAIIEKTSYKLLDEIVGILNEYTDYYMTIDGFTDNVGTSEKNLKLSKERADAVKIYFVSKGISDKRLVTGGYGDTQPVASNKTAEGRAKNRRVALDLKLMDDKK